MPGERLVRVLVEIRHTGQTISGQVAVERFTGPASRRAEAVAMSICAGSGGLRAQPSR
jgi:hypothetical protein